MDTYQKRYTLLAFRIIGDFGATMAVPVVVLVYFAQLLRDKYQVGLWLTILSFVCSALLSSYLVWKKAKQYGKEYNEMEK